MRSNKSFGTGLASTVTPEEHSRGVSSILDGIADKRVAEGYTREEADAAVTAMFNGYVGGEFNSGMKEN